MLNRVVLLFISIALLFPGSPAFALSETNGSAAGEEGGALIVACHPDYPPFEYYDSQKGEFTGFNVEILNALADRMGVKIEYRRMSKPEGLLALRRKQVDSVLGITYSIARDELMDFTSPLCTISDAIFVRDGTEDITSIVDLEGRTVVVYRDELGGEVFRKQEYLHLVPTDSYEHALDLLERGDVAAFIGSRLTGQYLIKKRGSSNIKVVGSPIRQLGYCIAVHEDNHALVSRLEKALSAMKQDGEYDRIFRSWFGEDLTRQSFLARFLFWVFAGAVAVLSFAGWIVNRRLSRKVETSEKELAESHTRFQRKADEYASLFEGASDAILIISPSDGHFLDVNRKAEELTGYDREELLRMSMRDIHRPTDGARVDKRLAQLVSEGSAAFDDAPVVRKDGTILHVDISASLIKYSGREVIQSFLRDVTEKRLLEGQLVQAGKLASIGAFTAGLAHEIRNPLNSVNLQLLLLERRIKDGARYSEEESLELINIVREEVSRLDNLVTEFLFFAKPQKLDLHPNNLHRILDDVFALFQARIAAGNIVLRREYMDNIPLLSLDAEKVKQALINIVQNSIEAMTGGGLLRVSTRMRNRRIMIEIEDSGAGIAKEDLDKVLDVFYTGKERGIGLGLPISFHIIEMHGGTLDIESREDEGTTCAITFAVGPAHYKPAGGEDSVDA